MMSKFHIEKLIVMGSGKEPSILEFGRGLNIICGPSDTGKSYVLECLDYLFGSDRIRFDRTAGYDRIKLIIVIEGRKVTLSRQLDTNRVEVHSDARDIMSGTYKTSGKKNNISDLWLQLIGIEEEHNIIKNSRFEKQRLTWRTFSHMFLIKETSVLQERSIILPRQNTSTTAALSALFFLITGIDFAKEEPLEKKEISEARRKALVDYMHKQLITFADRKEELGNIPYGALDLQAKVEAVLDDIAKTEKAIAKAIEHNKQLLKEIFSVNAQLAECNTLYNRYQALGSQYAADVKRLAFIVEGELNRGDVKEVSKCPFCESNVPVEVEEGYIEASHAELHRIQLQLSDLKEANEDIVKERSALEARLADLNHERWGIEDLLSSELKPKVAALKKTLAEYRRAIEIQNETTVIDKFETSVKTELFNVQMEDDSQLEFKIKNQFSSNILGPLDERLNNILDLCMYEKFESAFFDPREFDVVVNGKPKESFGKGYRTFLNTVLAVALMEYLVERGKYAPGLLVVDSPILSLKERGDESAPDSMKAGLFQYLLDNQHKGQVIIVENEPPALDYTGANLITFTKDTEHGRYGFLHGVR